MDDDDYWQWGENTPPVDESPGWYDNGDGSFTDEYGDIYDSNSGQWVGSWNDDGTWSDTQGNVFDADNNPIQTMGPDDTDSEAPQISVPSNWIDNQDGSVTDPTTGDVWGIDGTYLGNTADAGLGGGNVVYDPDQFGDVYTVNGKWIGNLYGLPAPGSSNSTSARGPGNTPGGAFSSGNFGGQNSGGQQKSNSDILKQLQQMLAAAKTANAPVSQQAAIANAIRNVQSKTDFSKYLLPGAVALLAAAVLLRK